MAKSGFLNVPCPERNEVSWSYWKSKESVSPGGKGLGGWARWAGEEKSLTIDPRGEE